MGTLYATRIALGMFDVNQTIESFQMVTASLSAIEFSALDPQLVLLNQTYAEMEVATGFIGEVKAVFLVVRELHEAYLPEVFLPALDDDYLDHILQSYGSVRPPTLPNCLYPCALSLKQRVHFRPPTSAIDQVGGHADAHRGRLRRPRQLDEPLTGHPSAPSPMHSCLQLSRLCRIQALFHTAANHSEMARQFADVSSALRYACDVHAR
jgi:hypothetical protein